jgi:hypothetical protein
MVLIPPAHTGAAVIVKEQAYLGWRFGFETESRSYDSATLRFIGHQADSKLLLLRRGNRYRYASYDLMGHLVRVVVSDGETTSVSSDGKTFHRLEPATAVLVNTEAALFCNDFHGIVFEAPRTLRADSSIQATKANLLQGTIEVAVRPDGALAGVAISTVNGVELLRPTAVTAISATERFYSVWKRNDEPEIVWDRLEPHPKVYASEIALPG